MITRTYQSIKYNPAGEAKAREQKRLAEREVNELNKLIKPVLFQGFGFRLQNHASRGGMYLEGPLCPREDTKGEPCLSELTGSADRVEVHCDVCDFSSNLPRPLEEFKHIARKKLEGHQRFIESGGKIETLDVPYEAIKAFIEDETREIKIKWSQKDGRNMAVIYFIEKGANGDKSQVMVDMDREEIRYDPSDIPPGKILAKISAEFPNSEVEVKYKNNQDQTLANKT